MTQIRVRNPSNVWYGFIDWYDDEGNEFRDILAPGKDKTLTVAGVIKHNPYITVEELHERPGTGRRRRGRSQERATVPTLQDLQT